MSTKVNNAVFNQRMNNFEELNEYYEKQFKSLNEKVTHVITKVDTNLKILHDDVNEIK